MFAYSLPHPPPRGECVVVTGVGAIEGGEVPDVPSWESAPRAARLDCLVLRMEKLRPRVTLSVEGWTSVSRPAPRGTLAVVKLEAETMSSDFGLGSILWLQPPLALA